VLVLHDIPRPGQRPSPARASSRISLPKAGSVAGAVQAYADAVRGGTFPDARAWYA
jgi:ketopantoate hydroxymethyltransferase